MQLRIDQLLAESTWVRRIALSLLRNAQDAEDVTQEVLQAAYEQRPSATGSSLRAWLRTVTKRKAARRRLLEGRRSRAERESARPELDESSVAERMALHSTLARAVGDLPPLLAEAVMLRYFDDLAPRQIAKRLNVTNEVARQRVSRGLKLLRQRLDHESDPKDPAHGRELWSAALVESLTLKQVAVMAPLSTLMLMSLKLPSILAGSVLLLASLFWATSSPDDVELSSTKQDLTETLIAEPKPEPSVIETTVEETTARLALTTEVPGALASRTLQIRRVDATPPEEAVAVWIDDQSGLHPLEVDEDGNADLSSVPSTERVWIASPGHLSGYLDLEPSRTLQEYTLDPGQTVLGRLIEDGGIPRAPVTLYARWVTPYLEQLEEDRVPETLWHELRLGYRGTELRPDATGNFEVPAQFPETELRFSLPSSHVYEAEFSSDSGRWVTTPLPGETVLLRTLRTLSISARVLRADNGLPARYCPGYFHFRDRNGEKRGSIADNCDSHGVFSAGYTPEGWRSMTPGERDAEKERWIYAQWQFSPNDPSLDETKGRKRLEGDEFFVDLGEIYLDPLPVLSAKVVNAEGHGVDRAAVRVRGEVDILHSNLLGQLELPASVRETGLSVLARGYSQTEFSGRDLVVNEEGLVLLQIERGIEVHLTIAEDSYFALESAGEPWSSYRVSVSWQESPFIRRDGDPNPFDFILHGALLDLNQGLGGLSQREGPQTGVTSFPVSGVVRLLSLLPDVPLEFGLRRRDGSLIDHVRMRTPKEPGVTRIELHIPEKPAQLDGDHFRIAGRLTDERGLPVAGSRLMYRIDSLTGYLGTDENGQFSSHPLRNSAWPTADEFRLYIYGEGYATLDRPWTEFASGEVADLNLVQPQSRRLEVRAVTASETPVTIESASWDDRPDVYRWIDLRGETTPEGGFLFDGAPRVPMDLSVRIDGQSHRLTVNADDSEGLLELDSKAR